MMSFKNYFLTPWCCWWLKNISVQTFMTTCGCTDNWVWSLITSWFSFLERHWLKFFFKDSCLHFDLHVQPRLDATLTIVTMFDLWIIKRQHDNLFIINFISKIWKPYHVTIGFFRPMTLLGTSWQGSWGPCLNCLVSLPRFVLCEKWRYSFGEHDDGFEVNDFMWSIDFAYSFWWCMFWTCYE